MLVSMALPTLFVGGCLYYLIITVMAERIALPDLMAKDLMPVINTINYVLLIGLPVVFIVLIVWATVLSYKFLAPLERLEEDIARIDQGDYSVRVQLARDHDLSPIAGVINHLMDKLEDKERR